MPLIKCARVYQIFRSYKLAMGMALHNLHSDAVSLLSGGSVAKHWLHFGSPGINFVTTKIHEIRFYQSRQQTGRCWI